MKEEKQSEEQQPSASELADKFCDEMIENLRNNIAKSKSAPGGCVSVPEGKVLKPLVEPAQDLYINGRCCK